MEKKEMTVFDCILTRRSIRRYSDIPVEWDKVGKICEAGKAAPSSGNIQNWKFVVVTKEETRKKVAQACLEQYWMAQAPVHIIVCGEPKKAQQFYGIRGDRLYTVQNCAAATMNMILMAHSLGLGSCWVGAFDEEMLKRALAMPDRARPQSVITIGYSDEKPPMPQEYNLEDVAYLENFKAGYSVIKYHDLAVGEFATPMQAGLEKGGKFAAKYSKKFINKLKQDTERLSSRIKDKFSGDDDKTDSEDTDSEEEK
jgi:nitroreductase